MRALIAALAVAVVAGAWAQDKAPRPKKKPDAAKQKAHKKATPEQIRRFNELAKKRQTESAK